jgi:predicted Zn-dependent peptidase
MRLINALALAVTLATPALAQPPDRTAAPRPGPAPRLTLPAVQKHALGNGLAVWIVERHTVPTVHLTLVVKAGSAADPAGKYGLASLSAAMLAEGAGGKDSLAIADAVDYLGAQLTTASSFDASFVSLHVPVARLGDALAIVSDVVQRPDFPQKELDRLREQRLTALRTAKDNPPQIAAAAFPRLVFGAHRYGTGAAGTMESLKGLTREDLQRFHASWYRPDNATLVVAGDVTPGAVLPQLEKALGAWRAPAAAPPAVALTAPAPLKARTVYLVDKPGAAQSVIRIGAVGVARSTPDYFPIEIMNTILGGSFTSRLNQNLREQHGYAYGASSAFDMRATAGPFFAGASVQTDKTAESVTEFFNELSAIRKPVSADELAKAKNYVALGFPGQFQTSRDLAGMFADLVVYGLPDDYYRSFVDRVQAVTAADIARAANQYVQPDRLAVVIVGDRKVIEAMVRQLNLGPVQVLTVDDVVK